MGSLCFTQIMLIVFATSASMLAASRRPYIIHMDKSAMPAHFSEHESWHVSILSSLSSPDGVSPTHLYSYTHVLDGFSAMLSRSHLDQIENLPGHLATYPGTLGELHTTHTPKFLGLKKHAGLWPTAGFGDDMIIGVVDTGVWPESDGFNDESMPPVPERWRGGCEIGVDFNASHCNKKLIGAKSFSKALKQIGGNISKTDDYDSPRDFVGHGTHTSSTAAGSKVNSVDYFGYAKGTATGIAPMARLAMYKVLFAGDQDYDATASDTLDGMDQAIADGVDLMSLSLGFLETPFDENPIAIGAFPAMRRGIFVSCSAGNSGPHAYTIKNGAPWITTVAAGTVDREFVAQVVLNDDLAVAGKSVFPENLLVSRIPIYFGIGNITKERCYSGALDPADVAGKYVFCDQDTDFETNLNGQINEVVGAGAAGAIIRSDSGQFLSPHDFNTPFVALTLQTGEKVKNYLLAADDTTVTVNFGTTLLKTKSAPQVAFFSSRGPDRPSPYILKPDILAPGVDILAAWAPNRGFTPIGESDYLLSDYALCSGTSMSSPHAIGVASLLKSVHRDWSPAAIRSAMMTTAAVHDNSGGRILDMSSGVAGTPLDFGAGHVSPDKAMDPGLIYDLGPQDYINYLCGLNYSSTQIRIITGESDHGCEFSNLDINYPSFMIILNNTNKMSYTFKRVLTNVDDSEAVYVAAVEAPAGMDVIVKPETVVFAGKGSVAEFEINVEIELSSESDYIGNYGFLSWYEVNGKHVVTSPIVSAFAP